MNNLVASITNPFTLRQAQGERIFHKQQANIFLCLGVIVPLFSGCATFGWKSAHEKQLESDVEQMKDHLSEAEKERQRLQREHAEEIRRLLEEKEQATQQVAEEKTQEANELIHAQRRLAENLKKELGDARAKLEMTERGLVLTFLDEIFFDSGKAEIKPDGLKTLQKVGPVLKETVPDSPVAIEGYTDNVPIQHSGWKSNWELSAARAGAVLHYFIDGQGIKPQRLRIVGVGEYQPVASNESAEGRRQNRRVEIVILPSQLKKVKPRLS